MGDTIYNLPKFSELELEGERPLYPPKIFSTEVVWNPFDDIIPRVFDAPKPQQDTATLATNKQVAKTKAVKCVATRRRSTCAHSA
jgi:peptidyl-prolyl cis-trans isomerase SDCCAG10